MLNGQELVDIMKFAERTDNLVISDEIYESLIYDEPSAYLTCLSFRRCPPAHDRG